MLVCKVCGSMLVSIKKQWVCSFETFSPDMAKDMYEKPHTKEVDKRVNA